MVMNARSRLVLISGVVLILAAATPGIGFAQTAFRAQPPLSITSCGQSPDAYTVSLLTKRVKLDHTFDNVMKPESLKAGSTLVVVMGGSAKGLGEAGIDEKGEIARVITLLTRAKEQKVKIIGAHVGGESRRGPLSDKFIDPVTARADYLIVTEDGNKDGAFTRASKARGIPLVVVKQLTDVGKELRALFPAP
jgi:hypothetical protein